MIRVLLGFLLVIALAGVAAWLAENPGQVAVEWRDLRIETSVAAAGLLLLALLAVLAMLYRLWLWLSRGPAFFGASRRQRRQRHGYQALTRGMVAAATGDTSDARRFAAEAERLLDNRPLTLLLNAQAAHLAGDDAAAERSFTAMLQQPETEVLGLRGLLSQAARRGERSRAIELAERARRLRPDAPWLLRELLALQAAEGNWREAEAVLLHAMKRKVITAEDGNRQHAVLLHERARAAEAAGLPAEALKLARRAHGRAPDLVPAAVLAAQLLHAQAKDRKAGKILRESWARLPHPSIADAYLGLGDGDPARRQQRLRDLAGAAPGRPESRLLLAEAALSAGELATARKELEPLLGDRPGARAAKLMAELEEREYGDAASAREWLLRATVAPVEPAWHCTACGWEGEPWQPHCPDCHTFDSLRWRSELGSADVPAAQSGRPAQLPALIVQPAATAPRPAE